MLISIMHVLLRLKRPFFVFFRKPKAALIWNRQSLLCLISISKHIQPMKYSAAKGVIL